MSSARSDDPKATEETKPPTDPQTAKGVDDEPGLPGVTVYSDGNTNTDPPLAVDGLVGSGTKGPVAADDSHGGWINIETVSQGLHQPVSGAAGEDPPPPGDPSVIGNASGDGAEEQMKFVMQDVSVASYSFHGGSGSEQPTEAPVDPTVDGVESPETDGPVAAEDPHQGWINPLSFSGDFAGRDLPSSAGSEEPPPPDGPTAIGTEGGDESEHTYLKFELQNVQVTSIDVNASGNDEAPLEPTDPSSIGTAGGDVGEEALRVDLTNVMVTSYQTNSHGDGGPPGHPIAGDWDGDDDLLLAELEPTGEIIRTGVGGDTSGGLEELVEGGGLDEILDL